MASTAKVTSKALEPRAKLTFLPGQLASILKKHMSVLMALRADHHADVQQELVGELILEMRRASARITAPALMEAMNALTCRSDAKKLATSLLLEVWQRIIKRLKYATSGARLSTVEKAFFETWTRLVMILLAQMRLRALI
eukprot:568382-Amphidinium_carterae.1